MDRLAGVVDERVNASRAGFDSLESRLNRVVASEVNLHDFYRVLRARTLLLQLLDSILGFL